MPRAIKNTDVLTETSEIKRRGNAIIAAFETLADKDKISVFEKLGMGRDFFTCKMCGRVKKKRDLYTSYDEKVKSGSTCVCKSCVKELIYPNGRDSNKNTIMDALSYMDKPFLNELYDNVITDRASNLNKMELSTIWDKYIGVLCTKKEYLPLRYQDGDTFRSKSVLNNEYDLSKDARSRYDNNKRDVIRMVGYDPFANYPDEKDKPLLYAQFVNFADEDAKDDGMKLAAILQIVKKLNQAEKLNEHIDMLVNDSENIDRIQKLEDTSKKTIDIVNNLAKDNGISVNHNNNKSKGANTLSGKMKHIQEKGFRDISINTFDIDTCNGMRQVAELSNQAIRNQLGNDENILTETLNASISRTQELEVKCAEAVEKARLLLVENIDLKNYLKELGLMDEYGELKVVDGSG